MSLKNFMVLALLVSLVIGVALTGGCVRDETATIEDITPQEAFTLIQNNQNNPDFVIIDVRTPAEFAEEHIENAIIIDYYSETFRDELNLLDKNKTYLIYCQSGRRSGMALDIMAELNFSEVYDMLGGFSQWDEEGLPTIQQTTTPGEGPEPPVEETPTQIIESITPQEAFSLIQESQDNSDLIIIDVRTPGEFAEEHLENAVNLDFYAETFWDWLNILDEDKMYLIYCRSGRRSADALAMMEELNFKEAYNMLGGIIEWKAGGLPTIQETPIQIIEDITPQEVFTLIQQNQNNPDFVIIDLDSSESFARGHIENAINIDYSSKTIRDELNPLDRDKTYLLYCRCSGRGISGKTADVMAELDFREVYVLLGGLNQWKTEGFPTVK